MKYHNLTNLFLIFIVLPVLLLGACQAAPEGATGQGDGRLRVVATTTFLGDVVQQIAGTEVDLVVLLKPGQNPHSYTPSPQDLVNVNQADLLIVNGLGLEEFLAQLQNGAEGNASLVVASEGIQVLEASAEHALAGNGEGAHLGLDPHVWMDPDSLAVWVANITSALAEKDPDRAEFFQANARVYLTQLADLDSWIQTEIASIPAENRELISDHVSLGYFARAYGLDQIGAVIPALTTEAETSGKQLAELIDIIRQHQARAIFVGYDFDPTLTQRVAEETGTAVVRLYFGSLSDGPPAANYLDFMRYDVGAIVAALKE